LIEFSKKEIEFLETLEEARIATSHNNIPHVKPVSFVYHKGEIIVATDYGTRTFTNIKINPNTAITIDVYKSGNHKAICIQGKSKIIEKVQSLRNFMIYFIKNSNGYKMIHGKKMRRHF